MSIKNYSELLKDPRWQKKRLKIMERDGFKCQVCSDEKTTLNIHHKKYLKGKAPWEYPDDLLITYCEDCHEMIEICKKNLTDFDNSKFKAFKVIDNQGKIEIYNYKNRGIMILLTDQQEYCSVIGFNEEQTLALYNFINQK